ncbi:hypothetical protein GY15_16715 [Delftia sp. 670]|uniref:Uncharacterized protein n=1 Tax=Pseudomonas phage PaP1 TaxID=685892 RepID=G0YVC3_9CAUD|nr:hypothetical protein PaP1_gp120 [Pseudomonas phage PaP1]AEK21660.1 hypothetical protein PaP1_gp120 [Pseudomonas phage PaP1]KEH08671.1 hypothetical protein GY14_17285 [Delftia tsuruhatensis]KEH13001.1 hypothetical protein GY15_16715 [Delftia sp. 670]
MATTEKIIEYVEGCIYRLQEDVMAYSKGFRDRALSNRTGYIHGLITMAEMNEQVSIEDCDKLRANLRDASEAVMNTLDF